MSAHHDSIKGSNMTRLVVLYSLYNHLLTNPLCTSGLSGPYSVEMRRELYWAGGRGILLGNTTLMYQVRITLGNWNYIHEYVRFNMCNFAVKCGYNVSDK